MNNKGTLLLAFLLLGLLPAARAQHPALVWARSLSSATGTTSSALLTNDAQGNVYLAGTFSGTVDFDPGAGTVSLTADTAFGRGTGFLAKYDGLGGFLYVRQLPQRPECMAVNSLGQVVTAGGFRDTRDFDPGTGTASLSSAGSTDAFIAVYDGSNGSYMTAWRFGSTSLYDHVYAISIGPGNDIFATGDFGGTVDFDPGTGTTNLSSLGVSDSYLVRYSAAGALVYALDLRGNSNGSEEGIAVCAMSNGSVVLGGRFIGSIDLDPGPGTASFTSNGLDCFQALYDAGGNYISGFNLDGNIYAMTLDPSGDRYMTGTMPDSMDVDPGPGKAMLYGYGTNFDMYWVKYNSAGSYLAARAFRSNAVYFPSGIAATPSGISVISGRFSDTVDFYPPGLGAPFVSAGSSDGFLLGLDNFGNVQFASAYGSPQMDAADAVSIFQSSLFTAGTFRGSIDFDPGPGTTVLSTTGAAIYFGRYGDAGNGTALQPAAPQPRVFGLDDAVVVDLTSLPSSPTTITLTDLTGRVLNRQQHSRADMVRISLPATDARMLVVTVTGENLRYAGKVMVR